MLQKAKASTNQPLVWVTSLWNRKKRKIQVKAIIVYRLGSIGDAVVALPCFHRIAKSFPDYRRIVLTNHPISTIAAPVMSVLGQSGLIHGTINYNAGERRLGELLNIRSAIRALDAEALVYLTEPRGKIRLIRDLLFFKSCGVPEIIGAPTTADLFYHRVDPTTGWMEREAERLARCMSRLGPVDVAKPQSWSLSLTDAEKARAQNELASIKERKFVAINIGGKVVQKDWGDKNWTMFLQLLSKRMPELALVLFGAADEERRCAQIATVWSGPTVNLCGRLSPRESAAAMSLAQMFIGHDSGPMHLAASVGIPCVALFGDYNLPKKWHPIGDGHRVIHNMGGISKIEPSAVFAAALEVFNSRQFG